MLPDDIIKWRHFPHYWPFVRGIHRSQVNSPHKGQWRGALMFSLICAWINSGVNNREAGDLRRYLARYDVIVMFCQGVGHVWPVFGVFPRSLLFLTGNNDNNGLMNFPILWGPLGPQAKIHKGPIGFLEFWGPKLWTTKSPVWCMIKSMG